MYEDAAVPMAALDNTAAAPDPAAAAFDTAIAAPSDNSAASDAPAASDDSAIAFDDADDGNISNDDGSVGENTGENDSTASTDGGSDDDNDDSDGDIFIPHPISHPHPQVPLIPPRQRSAVYPEPIDVTVRGGSSGEPVRYYIGGDPDDVTLQDGKLVARRAGTYHIWAYKPGNRFFYPVAVDYSVTIEPKPVSVQGIEVRDKIYDGSAAAEFISVPYFAEGAIEPIDAELVTLVPGTPGFTDINAGEDIAVTFTPFVIEGSRSENYTLIIPEKTTASIAKRELSVTAASQTITYGEDIPLEISIAGFADGESAESLTELGFVLPSALCELTKFAAAGEYPGAIIPSGGEATGNYEFNFIAGSLTVMAATPTRGVHYTVTDPSGSNGWTSVGDFIITPGGVTETSGFTQISVDGEAWSNALIFSEERAMGDVSFYLRDDTTGAVSLVGSERLGIDRTPPVNLSISYSETPLKSLLRTLSFGYYNPDVTVTITAEDTTSGVASFNWAYTREPGASETNVAAMSDALGEAEISYSENGREATASFTLTAEDFIQYRGGISFTATDRAGNESEAYDGSAEQLIVVDTIAPEVIISYSGELSRRVASDSTRDDTAPEDVSGDTRFIYSGDVTAVIEITEANFYPGDVSLTVTKSTDGEPEIYALTDATTDAMTDTAVPAADWLQNGDTWTRVFTLSGDGDYIIELAYSDRSGNDMGWVSGEFDGKTGTHTYTSNALTIDATSPTMDVTLGAASHGAVRTAVIYIADRNFRPTELIPVISARDIQDIATDFDVEALTAALRGWERWTEIAPDVWMAEISFSADARYEFALEYADLAGNAAKDYIAAPFTVDATPPENLSIAYSNSLLSRLIETVTFGYYSTGVTVTITAEDLTSGVESFDWTYTREPGASAFDADTASGQITSEEITYSADGKTATASFTLTADDFTQYRGGISFTATDSAGNESEAYDGGADTILVVDTIAPEVTITFDGEPSRRIASDSARADVAPEDANGDTRLIHSGDVTATITVTEANFYPAAADGFDFEADFASLPDLSLAVTRSIDGAIAPYPLAFGPSDWTREGEGDTYTLSLTLSGDGDYSIELAYSDRSGNAMRWASNEHNDKLGAGRYKSNPITIDATAPTFEITYTPASSSGYRDVYRTPRLATVRVTDRNFRPTELLPVITARDIRGSAAAFDIEALTAALRTWERWTEISPDVWETEISFSADARYEFSLGYADLAGNAAAEYTAEPFTVDTAPPTTLTVTYSAPLLDKLLETLTFGYYNPDVTVTITAEDAVSGVDRFNWTYMREQDASASNIETESGRIGSEGITYSNGGRTATASFTLTADEARQYRGSITFTATDKAGNTGAGLDDSAANVLVVDTISPTRSVSYPVPRQIVRRDDLTTVTEPLDDFLSRETTDAIFYYDDAVTITLLVTEANFYPEDIAVEVLSDADSGFIPTLDWIKSGDAQPDLADEYRARLTLTDDGDYHIKLTYTDRSNNEMTSYTSGQLTVDKIDPVIAVAYTPNDVIRVMDDTRYYDAVQTAEITITERNFRADDVIATITAHDSEGRAVAEGLIAELSEQLSRRSAWRDDGDRHTASISYSADAAYSFDIEYCDLALRSGAEYEAERLTIDRAPPINHTITFSESLFETVLETVTFGFYNARVTAEITAEDEVSGVYSLTCGFIGGADASGINGEIASIEIPYEALRFTNGGRTAAASIELPPETSGVQLDGSLEVMAYDRSGNGSGISDERRVIVDTIAPNMTVTYSAPTRSQNGTAYYAGDISVAIDITEANFHSGDVSVSTAQNGGEARAVAPEWSRLDGDTHRGGFIISGEGSYTARVMYADRSGNRAEPYVSSELVIDATAPLLTIDGIAHESANNAEVIGFMLSAEDLHFDPDSFAPALTAVVMDDDGAFSTVDISPGAPRRLSGGRYVYEIANLDADGIYSLTCGAFDMSGNRTEEILVSASGAAVSAVEFSVNRRGSTFMPDAASGALAETYYTQAVYNDVVITETNADPLLEYAIKIGGSLLTENEHYTLERSGGEGSWYKYVYRVHKSVFEREGEYNLVISSRDKADNNAYSDMRSAEVSFVVDKTAPILTVSGIKQDGRYQSETQRVVIIPRDDGGRLGSLKAIVTDGNGETTVPIDLSGDELLSALDEGGGALNITLATGMGQRVELICADRAVNAAGEVNVSRVVYSNVTVSTNALVIFYANKPLLYGSAAGTAGAGAALSWLLRALKLRKKIPIGGGE
jgi:hypothetical protein